MNRLVAAILFCVLCASPAFAASLQVDPLPMALGQPAVVRACLPPGVKQAEVEFMGRRAPLTKGADGCFYGAVAADLQDATGKHAMRVYGDGKQTVAAKVKLFRRDRGTRRITVDPKFLKLSPQALARYKRERKMIQEAYASSGHERYWQDGFQLPLNSKVVSAFGRRSIVNGQEKSPHGGVDLRGATGTPVPAAADGRVALVLDTYFGGLTILIDHGQGVFTRYLHLSAADVKQGNMVKKGQIIGKVGASGRVTGPHLDFGVKISGARVDPLEWVPVSKKLARNLGER